MTYDPRQTFSAQQSAYGRASGVTSSKSNANKQAAKTMKAAGIGGLGGKPTTSAAQRIQDKFRRETQRDSDRSKPVTPQKNFLGNLLDRVKSSILFAGGDPERKRRPDPNPGALYTASPFILPAVTAVATTTLGPAPVGADATGMPSIYTPDTREFGTGIQPMEAPEKPESAKIDIFDPFKEKVKRADEAPGLMAPPSMKQPAAPATAMSAAMATNINKTLQSILSPDPDVPYVIQAGDTLSEIAVKTGTTVKELQELNNIEKADDIFTGNELIIPSAKSTKTKEDIVSSLIGGMGGVSELGSSFEGDAVQTAMSVVPNSIISDVTSAEDKTRKPGLMVKPKIRPKSIEVKAVQSALTKLGYNPNGVDGVIGGGTQRAIRKFQKQNGLPVTGEMTKETQSAILADNAESYFDPPKRDAEVTDFSESDFYIYKEAVAEKESSNRYNIRGGANNHYLGKYQMGKDALSDVGIKYNRASNRKFLTNPEQQEKAFKKYTEKNHKKLTQESQAYREMTPKEKLAVLGYAHNQGATAAVEFLFTGVSGKDANGTLGKEYIDLVTDAFSRNQPIPRPPLKPENL